MPLPVSRLVRACLLVLLAVLATGGCAPVQPAAGETRLSAPEPPATLSVAAVETAVFEAVNAARVREGRTPLAADPALARIARSHSERMAAVGFFDHRDDTGALADARARAAGYAYRRFGENLFRGALWDTRTTRRAGPDVAVTYNWHTPASLAREVVQGWLSSPAHRANMLSPDFTHHGIGVATDEAGEVYVTQNLSVPRGS